MRIPQAYGVDWDDYDKILVERVALSDGDLPATVLRLPIVWDREYPPTDVDVAQFDYVAEDAILSRAIR